MSHQGSLVLFPICYIFPWKPESKPTAFKMFLVELSSWTGCGDFCFPGSEMAVTWATDQKFICSCLKGCSSSGLSFVGELWLSPCANTLCNYTFGWKASHNSISFPSPSRESAYWPTCFVYCVCYLSVELLCPLIWLQIKQKAAWSWGSQPIS